MFEPQLRLEHADSRGEIYSIELPDGQELMLLHSKAGSFRGGHSHSCGEVVVMLSGLMHYYKQENGHEHKLTLPSGCLSHNRAGQVHMGEFVEDSWVVEYKLGTRKGEWTQEDYEPYRAKVRASA